MEFRILGPLEVWDEGRVLPIGGTRQRALLAILLLSVNRVVPLPRLIDLLWQGQSPETATNVIQVYVAHLRRILESERTGAAPPYRVLVHHSNGYAIHLQPDQLDAHRFEMLLHAADRARSELQWQRASERLREALALWKGPVLGEFATERFALAEIARLEELRLCAIEDRIEVDLNLDHHAAILPELRALVAEHPLRERLCGQLMLALYRNGLQAQASDVYHRTRGRLLEELGMEPGPVLERLFRDILRHAGYLEAGSRYDVPNNLPHSLTRFIGRRTDLTQLGGRLEAVRLLTLTGAGGIGKTRLAIELAGRLMPRYPDGIWLIDLAPIANADTIVQRIASELGLAEKSGEAILDAIVGHLRERRALTILDNCERLLDTAADVAGTLLSRCSQLTIVATSRQRFGMAGEQVWQVLPLSVPDRVAGIDDLMRSEAVQLFVDRAVLVQPNFELTPETIGAIAQICLRLDGIPLALELAAAQLGTVPLPEIAARLDDRFTFLVGAERGRPARHQTLAAALEWSHGLLAKSEQVLFRRLGVFSGGFDLRAIASVCGPVRRQTEVAGPMRRLVDASLVVVDGEDRNRFRMLETMREFARGKVRAAGERQWLGRKHAEHFLSLVQEHGGKLRSRGAIPHLTELDWNVDNIRAALEWTSANDHSLLERLTLGLHAYWSSRCLFREAMFWVRLALADCASPLRLPLLNSLGWLELASDEVEPGLQHSQEALTAAHAAGDRRGEMRALVSLCEARASHGDREGSMKYIERAVGLAEQVRRSPTATRYDEAMLGATSAMLAWWQMVLGDRKAARTGIVLGTELSRQSGDYFSEVLASCWRSEIDVGEGDIADAADLARHALELAVSIDHRFLMMRAIGQLAAVAAAQDQPDRALRLAAAVESARGATGTEGFHLFDFDFWRGWGWRARLQGLRDCLGPDVVTGIWNEGSRLSLYEAAAVALSRTTPSGLAAQPRLTEGVAGRGERGRGSRPLRTW
jgi:predicted ATPase/DNA-binding SARP family transcriptional activator